MKILAADYDGTFYTDDINVRRNIDAVKNFIQDGNIFLIATGRTLAHFKEKTQKQGIIVPYNYIICSDGGCMFDSNDNLIYSANINPEIVNKILSNLIENGNYYDISYSDGFHKYSSVPYNTTNVIGIRYKNENKAKELMVKLQKEYNINYRFLNEWVKIMNGNATKGSTIDFLRKSLYIKKEDVYVIGNEDNDISMITMFNGNAMSISADIVKDLHVKEYNQVYELIEEIQNMFTS